jgi:hypothetical protein
MRLKEIEDSYGFEEYLDDYLAHMAWHDKNPRKFDRTLLVKASQWIGWLNDDNMINKAYIRSLEKQVKELGGRTR